MTNIKQKKEEMRMYMMDHLVWMIPLGIFFYCCDGGWFGIALEIIGYIIGSIYLYRYREKKRKFEIEHIGFSLDDYDRDIGLK